MIYQSLADSTYFEGYVWTDVCNDNQGESNAKLDLTAQG